MENARARRHDKASIRQRKLTEGGQSLAEFALLLPLLCLLAIGIVEIGRAAFITFMVTNAATAGVEYGSQSETQASNIAQMQYAAICDANGGLPATGCSSGILNTSNTTATYGCYCDTGGGTSCTYQPNGQDCTGSNPSTCSCGTIATNCSASGDEIIECVEVLTHSNVNALFHFPGLPTTYQANGRAVMRVRR